MVPVYSWFWPGEELCWSFWGHVTRIVVVVAGMWRGCFPLGPDVIIHGTHGVVEHVSGLAVHGFGEDGRQTSCVSAHRRDLHRVGSVHVVSCVSTLPTDATTRMVSSLGSLVEKLFGLGL